jgi:hypothetical protein
MAYVRLQQDGHLGRFLNHDVIIDGCRFRCVDVRKYAPGPYRKGDAIGILVEDVDPSANGL